MLNIFGLKKQKQNKNITLEYTEHYKKSYLDYKLIIMLSNSTSVKQIKKESCTMKYKKKKNVVYYFDTAYEAYWIYNHLLSVRWGNRGWQFWIQNEHTSVKKKTLPIKVHKLTGLLVLNVTGERNIQRVSSPKTKWTKASCSESCVFVRKNPYSKHNNHFTFFTVTFLSNLVAFLHQTPVSFKSVWPGKGSMIQCKSGPNTFAQFTEMREPNQKND